MPVVAPSTRAPSTRPPPRVPTSRPTASTNTSASSSATDIAHSQQTQQKRIPPPQVPSAVLQRVINQNISPTDSFTNEGHSNSPQPKRPPNGELKLSDAADVRAFGYRPQQHESDKHSHHPAVSISVDVEAMQSSAQKYLAEKAVSGRIKAPIITATISDRENFYPHNNTPHSFYPDLPTSPQQYFEVEASPAVTKSSGLYPLSPDVERGNGQSSYEAAYNSPQSQAFRQRHPYSAPEAFSPKAPIVLLREQQQLLYAQQLNSTPQRTAAFEGPRIGQTIMSPRQHPPSFLNIQGLNNSVARPGIISPRQPAGQDHHSSHFIDQGTSSRNVSQTSNNPTEVLGKDAVEVQNTHLDPYYTHSGTSQEDFPFTVYHAPQSPPNPRRRHEQLLKEKGRFVSSSSSGTAQVQKVNGATGNDNVYNIQRRESSATNDQKITDGQIEAAASLHSADRSRSSSQKPFLVAHKSDPKSNGQGAGGIGEGQIFGYESRHQKASRQSSIGGHSAQLPSDYTNSIPIQSFPQPSPSYQASAPRRNNEAAEWSSIEERRAFLEAELAKLGGPRRPMPQIETPDQPENNQEISQRRSQGRMGLAAPALLLNPLPDNHRPSSSQASQMTSINHSEAPSRRSDSIPALPATQEHGVQATSHTAKQQTMNVAGPTFQAAHSPLQEKIPRQVVERGTSPISEIIHPRSKFNEATSNIQHGLNVEAPDDVRQNSSAPPLQPVASLSGSVGNSNLRSTSQLSQQSYHSSQPALHPFAMDDTRNQPKSRERAMVGSRSTSRLANDLGSVQPSSTPTPIPQSFPINNSQHYVMTQPQKIPSNPQLLEDTNRFPDSKEIQQSHDAVGYSTNDEANSIQPAAESNVAASAAAALVASILTTPQRLMYQQITLQQLVQHELDRYQQHKRGDHNNKGSSSNKNNPTTQGDGGRPTEEIHNHPRATSDDIPLSKTYSARSSTMDSRLAYEGREATVTQNSVVAEQRNEIDPSTDHVANVGGVTPVLCGWQRREASGTTPVTPAAAATTMRTQGHVNPLQTEEYMMQPLRTISAKSSYSQSSETLHQNVPPAKEAHERALYSRTHSVQRDLLQHPPDESAKVASTIRSTSVASAASRMSAVPSSNGQRSFVIASRASGNAIRVWSIEDRATPREFEHPPQPTPMRTPTSAITDQPRSWKPVQSQNGLQPPTSHSQQNQVSYYATATPNDSVASADSALITVDIQEERSSELHSDLHGNEQHNIYNNVRQSQLQQREDALLREIEDLRRVRAVDSGGYIASTPAGTPVVPRSGNVPHSSRMGSKLAHSDLLTHIVNDSNLLSLNNQKGIIRSTSEASATSALSKAPSIASTTITVASRAPSNFSHASSAWTTTFSAVQARSQQLQGLLDDSAALMEEVGKRRRETRDRSHELREELRREVSIRSLSRERSRDHVKDGDDDSYLHHVRPSHSDSSSNIVTASKSDDLRRQLVRNMFLGNAGHTPQPNEPPQTGLAHTNNYCPANNDARSSSTAHSLSHLKPRAKDILQSFVALDGNGSGSLSLQQCLDVLNENNIGGSRGVSAGEVMQLVVGRDRVGSYSMTTAVPYAALVAQLME